MNGGTRTVEILPQWTKLAYLVYLKKNFSTTKDSVGKNLYCLKIFIEIPMEDWEPCDEMKVAKLNLSLYGTKDAAQNWTEEYKKKLVDLGFAAGVATPCHFLHSET